jgi:hypothetical protein
MFLKKVFYGWVCFKVGGRGCVYGGGIYILEPVQNSNKITPRLALGWGSILNSNPIPIYLLYHTSF